VSEDLRLTLDRFRFHVFPVQEVLEVLKIKRIYEDTSSFAKMSSETDKDNWF